MAKEFPLNIFKLLNSIDNRDFNYYDTLTDEEKKGFVGVVVMRWMTSVKKPIVESKMWHILSINTNVNKNLWNSSLIDHPKLVYLSLASCGVGKTQEHFWQSAPKKSKTGIIYNFIRKIYPMANDDELKLFLQINDINNFVELAEDMGWEKSEITKLKKELRKVL